MALDEESEVDLETIVDDVVDEMNKFDQDRRERRNVNAYYV